MATDRRRRRDLERGSSAVRAVIYLGLVVGGAYGLAYGYGSFRVGQIETALSRRIADAGRPTPAETFIDEGVVTRRIVEWAREEGGVVRPDDVHVTIEPINDTNFQRLPLQARIAIGAAQKMKNHDVDAAFISIRFTLRASWGPVKREMVLERDSWVPKSALH
jgi:hypothetical protein